MPIDEYGLSVCDHLRSANHSLSVQLAKAEARAEKMAEELTKYIRCELCGWDNDPTCPRCVRRETIEEVVKWCLDEADGAHRMADIRRANILRQVGQSIRRLIKQPVSE